ncbi:MAG: TauD/TfdA family dioxygenase, partial [Novosphingobium sp.]
GFGARVAGFAVDAVASAAQIATLQQAFDLHHLLIFRDCGRLAGERQAEIAAWFGTVGANRDAGGRLWTTLDNQAEVGSQILPFHCDITFMEHPFDGLCLHPLELPERGTSTTFVGNAVGWDALDADLQALLHNRKVCHRYRDTVVIAPGMPALSHWHPARLEHPRTGRAMGFVTENHVREIEGLSEAESAPYIARIFAAIYAPQRRYEHQWREGDLLVWNNLAVQHARTKVASMSAGRRIMQRVALGKHTFSEQLERLKAAAA